MESALPICLWPDTERGFQDWQLASNCSSGLVPVPLRLLDVWSITPGLVHWKRSNCSVVTCAGEGRLWPYLPKEACPNSPWAVTWETCFSFLPPPWNTAEKQSQGKGWVRKSSLPTPGSWSFKSALLGVELGNCNFNWISIFKSDGNGGLKSGLGRCKEFAPWSSCWSSPVCHCASLAHLLFLPGPGMLSHWTHDKPCPLATHTHILACLAAS